LKINKNYTQIMVSEILKIHQSLKSGGTTCADLIASKISELEKCSRNATCAILKETAMAKAQAVDAKLKAGQQIGVLEGVPFGLKDVYLLEGTVAAASSDMLKPYISPYTATAIQKLLDAGAIPIARENCDSFGHGSTSENTVYGPVANALDTSLVAGGSSGGSAVNVALSHTAFSIGGDTGGSIRQPAGYNQIFGLKPTYGRVSRYGLMAYCSSTDCVGPFARTAEDLRIVLNCISGRDEQDQTTINSEPVPESATAGTRSLSSFKVGYYSSFFSNPAMDSAIKKGLQDTIEKLKAAGAEIIEMESLSPELMVGTYYVLAMAETASNLARLDGTNYGARVDASNLKEGYMQCRSRNFTAETKRRIVGGNQVLSQGHSEEIYLKARAIRANMVADFSKQLSTADIILSPVAPSLPPKIGSSLSKPLDMYLSDAYTVGFSLGGLPTLTVPFGTPIGMQLTACAGGEQKIFEFATALNKIL
jgi:aspartyl-tRNA(Asn)/glutamyl-tRNA(Gln) amidotransferase subunit A